MSPETSPARRRDRFFGSGDRDAHAAFVLKLLLAQDGSTTRLCEAIAGGPVALDVHVQGEVERLPAGLEGALPGAAFLRRVTSLSARGEVMMDNVSYIALSELPADAAADLVRGRVPIGHVMRRLWIRREFIAGPAPLLGELWNTVGLPDAGASRCYRVWAPSGPIMVIGETFRRGMVALDAMSRRGEPTG